MSNELHDLTNRVNAAMQDYGLKLASMKDYSTCQVIDIWQTEWSDKYKGDSAFIALLMSFAGSCRATHMKEADKQSSVTNEITVGDNSTVVFQNNSSNLQLTQDATPADRPGRPSHADDADSQDKIRHVVLLVYGIRDNGSWQQRAATEIELNDGVKAISVKYDYFDAASFVSPFGLSDKPYAALLAAYTEARRQHPNAKISVIAHSYGTYLLGELLDKNPSASLYRVILCGSVLPRSYQWSEVCDKISRSKDGRVSVLNLCGSGDYWPVVAKFVSRRYGDAGRHGFLHDALVKTIWTHGGHSCFFNKNNYTAWGSYLAGDDDALSTLGNSSQPTFTFMERVYSAFSCLCIFFFIVSLTLVAIRHVVGFVLVVLLALGVYFWIYPALIG